MNLKRTIAALGVAALVACPAAATAKSVNGGSGKGAEALADVAVGDRVMVQAKVAGPIDPAKPVVARHFLDKGPVPPPSEDEEPKAPETVEPPAA
jgi:hypothetical protein